MNMPAQINITVKITSGTKEYSIEEFDAALLAIKQKIDSLGNSFGILGLNNFEGMKGLGINDSLQ